MSAAEPKNRLADETSPYLLQHASNPVAWYPWGEEALTRAREEDKPILLSVGYSACHWCHVMEHESFENDAIAELMNEHFVCIKVDREERPDIDEIYMNAVQIMTGSGGWPLTVFLTPELEPFYGGTYYPPEDRWGRPGFKTVLHEIARVYREDRDNVAQASKALTERLQTLSFTSASREILTRKPLGDAARELAGRFDSVEGGFSPAPKFPPSGALWLLMRHFRETRDRSALDMVELTLDKMASGGLYDHLGGGFHRYSTDARWLVPHFEKMLYDNALLVPAYLAAHQITKTEHYARVARECLEWVLREMQDDSGGYYSTQDADSEGEEGKFYVWSEEEIREILGGDADAFAQAYDVSPGGNWEGKNILHLEAGLGSWSAELSDSRKRLYEAREARVHPGLDDKILTSWNGLMIVAMARGFRILGEERFLDSARRAARFILNELKDGDRLLATHRAGRSKLKAYLDCHAFLLAGLVELYECDFDPAWLEHAQSVRTALETLFHDAERGGFFFTGSDHETLIARTKTGYDGAIPSGNAVAATYLLKLAEYRSDREAESLAVDTLHAFQTQMERSPAGFSYMLGALDFYLSTKREIAVVGRLASEPVQSALKAIWSVFAPNLSVAAGEPLDSAPIPLLEAKTPGPDPDQPRFYVCESYACDAPTDSLDEVVSALEAPVLE